MSAILTTIHIRSSDWQSMRLALWIVLGLGTIGAVFSGTLAYRELNGAAPSCAVTSSTILGAPSCVYGFAMFVFTAAIAAWGLLGSTRSKA